MILAALLCVTGLCAGFLLLWHIPICPDAQAGDEISVSIVIPARNEERNLPRLLQSIFTSYLRKIEVLVVDDASTDQTASVARKSGAAVIASSPLPAGWTGKAWACYQGAQHAAGEVLIFLDADTYFVPGGLERLLARWLREGDPDLALSLLPYHVMQSPYEQLSLMFIVLMAAGTGGFGTISRPKLFGQSLLISKETYFAVDGHAAVHDRVLENLYLARLLRRAGKRILCLSGRDTLHMRMFPDGLRQMSDSWRKAFLDGASESGSFVLACSVVWISALWTAALLFLGASGPAQLAFGIAYLVLSAQLAWISRQLGTYSFLTCLLYPIPLAYYLTLFCFSAVSRALGQKIVWRGREV